MDLTMRANMCPRPPTRHTGLPVYSLYGPTKKPTPQMLQGIDVLVYDIQDIGCRSYTFISTLGLAMEAAGEAHIKFYVLDRPNPLNGNRVEGMMLDPRFRGFTSQWNIPYVYGLTRASSLHDPRHAGLDQKSGPVHQGRGLAGQHRPDGRLVSLDVLGRHGADVGADVAAYPDGGNGAQLRGDRISRRSRRHQSRDRLHASLRGLRPSELRLVRPHHPVQQMQIPGVYFEPVTFKPFYGVFKDQIINGSQIYYTDRDKVNLCNLAVRNSLLLLPLARDEDVSQLG